jgi:hypothetical protein
VKHTLLQVDEFTPDAVQVRTEIIADRFASQTGPDGCEYTGICQRQMPHWFERISEAIERPVIPRLSFFRLNLNGELPHSWVHSDDICARYAGILYLNAPEQCKGGTAFWRHEGLNLDAMPDFAQMSVTEAHTRWFNSMMNREWKDLTFWDQVGFVGMKFNRFISYPTSRFHSRYPFEGFGSGPADGRLVWTCFYDIA